MVRSQAEGSKFESWKFPFLIKKKEVTHTSEPMSEAVPVDEAKKSRSHDTIKKIVIHAKDMQ